MEGLLHHRASAETKFFLFVCLLVYCFRRWDQQVSRLKKKSRDLTAGSGCSTAWMDRASSGLQLERGGATGKICAAAFYLSESDLGGSESGS